jgi:hypothetical protein
VTRSRPQAPEWSWGRGKRTRRKKRCDATACKMTAGAGGAGGGGEQKRPNLAQGHFGRPASRTRFHCGRQNGGCSRDGPDPHPTQRRMRRLQPRPLAQRLPLPTRTPRQDQHSGKVNTQSRFKPDAGQLFQHGRRKEHCVDDRTAGKPISKAQKGKIRKSGLSLEQDDQAGPAL